MRFIYTAVLVAWDVLQGDFLWNAPLLPSYFCGKQLKYVDSLNVQAKTCSVCWSSSELNRQPIFWYWLSKRENNYVSLNLERIIIMESGLKTCNGNNHRTAVLGPAGMLQHSRRWRKRRRQGIQRDYHKFWHGTMWPLPLQKVIYHLHESKRNNKDLKQILEECKLIWLWFHYTPTGFNIDYDRGHK